MKPFIALIYNDSKDYSRNRAAGMSYLNRFLIEEDTQFDCAEIVEWKLGSSWENSVQDLEKKFIKLSKKSNSDFIRHLFLSMDIFPNQKLSNILTDQPFKSLIKGLRTFSDTSHMITRIASRRLECVQKEHYECIQKEAYEKLYRERDKIEYNELRTDEVHQSIGNDIDDFYDRIKMNEINFVDRKLRKSPNSVKTFHLSMLSDQEERKMHSDNIGNQKFFTKQTTLSKKEQNYALSLCRRKTIHSGPLKNGKRYIREIKERDPWEERIKKNYEELQRLKRKRKAPETLEALEALDYYMFQTEWESESSDYSDSN